MGLNPPFAVMLWGKEIPDPRLPIIADNLLPSSHTRAACHVGGTSVWRRIGVSNAEVSDFSCYCNSPHLQAVSACRSSSGMYVVILSFKRSAPVVDWFQRRLNTSEAADLTIVAVGFHTPIVHVALRLDLSTLLPKELLLTFVCLILDGTS